MENFIKEVRTQIGIAEETLKHRTDSPELTLSYRQVQRGSMWLGLVLAALGTGNPYPQSTNPDNKTIEQRSDYTAKSLELPKGRIEGIKFLRGELQFIIDELKEKTTSVPWNEDGLDALKTSIRALKEAKMWLGMELNRIKQAEDQRKAEIEQNKRNQEGCFKQAYLRYIVKLNSPAMQPSWESLTQEVRDSWKASILPFIEGGMMSRDGRQDPWA